MFQLRTKSALPAAAALLASAVLAACGGDDGGGGGMSVSIAEPAKGAAVSLPFTVKVDAGVPLGPTESGKHHVHLWFDGDAENYLVVESDTATVNAGLKGTLSGRQLDLTPGAHVIHVSLRNANHSAAGADTELSVNVGSAGAPATPAPSEPAASSEDPYDY